MLYVSESERASTTKRKIAEIVLKMSIFLARLSRWIWFYAVANTYQTVVIRCAEFLSIRFPFFFCHFFLAGYFVRLCLGLDTLNMLYAKKFVDVGPKQHTFVRAQTQRVK